MVDMIMSIMFKNETYDVPHIIQGKDVFSILNIKPSGNFYIRKSNGEVIKFLESIIYEIEDGDILQELKDFILG